MSKAKPSFTGKLRERRTRAAVRYGDRIAKGTITVGGIGTIAAVLMVFVFLVQVAAPLFRGSSLERVDDAAVATGAEPPARLLVDEYRVLGLALAKDGGYRLFRLEDGRTIREGELLPGHRVTALASTPGTNEMVLGLSDGTFTLGEIAFRSTFPLAPDLPLEIRELPVGGGRVTEKGLIQRLGANQWRSLELDLRFGAPVDMGLGEPLIRIDRTRLSSDDVVAALSSSGRLAVKRLREVYNVMLDEKVVSLRGGVLADAAPANDLPGWLYVSAVGDNVFLVWSDGRLQRISSLDIEAPTLVESRRLLDGDGDRVTSASLLLGRSSLLIGTARGALDVWFRTKPPEATAPDGNLLVRGHHLEFANGAVTALAASSRSRLVALGNESGRITLLHVTSQKILQEVEAGDSAVQALVITPKDDGLVALDAAKVAGWTIDVGYPEASVSALFRPVWYEGYEKPEHVWQSTAGSDDVEPKLGLMPLVFGTIKATIYSLLFGVPIAILAAIYTSEFLSRRVRARVKPLIELSASLPSVVLGFLASLVFAPFVEHWITAIIAFAISGPLVVHFGARAWQLLPPSFTLRHQNRRPLVGGLILLPLAILLAVLGAPVLERAVFSGDVTLWLDGQVGDGRGAIVLFLMPAALLLAWPLTERLLATVVLSRIDVESRFQAGLFETARSLLALLSGLAAAWVVAGLLSAAGFDPRGSVVGTYVQRNALVVGFVMSFAVIPIIYTIAEDALSTVPEHLRAASLGAGATPWQTAIRVVVPTAMSGLFSAVMVGLGRAVGETMVVLMAAGNTPIMEWNLFNGFRTLSANIATELPEAMVNSVQYRVLFLAALVLFVMTFVLNTAAEVVRQRFRRRAFRL